jgi:hypothetical protein
MGSGIDGGSGAGNYASLVNYTALGGVLTVFGLPN